MVAIVACSVIGSDEVVEVFSAVVMVGSLDCYPHVAIRVLNGTCTLAWDGRSVFIQAEAS